MTIKSIFNSLSLLKIRIIAIATIMTALLFHAGCDNDVPYAGKWVNEENDRKGYPIKWGKNEFTLFGFNDIEKAVYKLQ